MSSYQTPDGERNFSFFSVAAWWYLVWPMLLADTFFQVSSDFHDLFGLILLYQISECHLAEVIGEGSKLVENLLFII